MIKTLFLTIAMMSAIVSSPDGKLQVKLDSKDSGVYYSVTYNGVEMMPESQIGLVTNVASYEKLRIESHSIEPVSDSYTLLTTKKSKIDYAANKLMVTMANPEGKKLNLEMKVSNNDIAFRYHFPKEGETGSARVLKELTSFNFPAHTTTFLTPQSDAMIGWKRTKPSYEEYYGLDKPMDVKSQYGHGYTFPCLFRIGEDGWVLVSETGVDSYYCASRLSDFNGSGYTIEYPMDEENNGNGTSEPGIMIPGKTPWRTITVGADLAPIVETTVAFDVVEPRYESKYDYDYGKSTWSWIVWQDPSINYEDQVKYIDLAAEMGFKYALVDSYWDETIGRDKVEELSKYAQSKGVHLFMWYSSSGWWNDIVQGPINVMSDHIARKREMEWLNSIGVKGIKVDFFGGDKQETMRHYESILSDADDNELMVIFHGCTLPRGWERMYPNFVGSEAVRASENLVFNQHDCNLEALNACLHPFIRNTVASMEFGGTFLNKKLSRNNQRGTTRRTTDVFQIATAVLFQNPVQNFAITPNNLEDAPKLCIDFMKEVPTIWDDTKFIDGYPGKNCVVARRNGNKWYVSAINAGEEEFKVDVKAIEALLGGKASAIVTDKEGPVLVEKFRKEISIPQNDGAVIMINL